MQTGNHKPDWNKSQRMQAKAVLCLVGIGLLIVIAFSLVMVKRGGDKRKKGEEETLPPASVTEELYNVYITEITDTYIGVFDGENKKYPFCGDGVHIGNAPDSFSPSGGQLADLTLTDGAVSRILFKTGERVSGKVIGVEAGVGVELENLGKLPFSEHVRFYMLYGELREGTLRDIRIGYNYADFVMEDGKICGVLMTRDESMQYIRVQIKNSDYTGAYHEAVTLSCDAAYTIYYGAPQADVSMGDASLPNTAGREEHGAGESLQITADSPYFSGENGSRRIYVVPSALTAKISLLSVNRSQGTPAYRGTMEISLTEKGFVIINEVLLEEYLYGVVPSEMPAAYPLEALKAQAVCARTYAYSHMLSPGLPDVGAHVDDSTGYQVYNNIMEQNSTTTAVKETAGQLLYYEGTLASTYYYSTSCGFGSDEHVWRSETAPELFYLTARSVSREGYEGTDLAYTADSMREESVFAQFLASPPETDFEKEEPWYRWSYEVSGIDSAKILKILQSRYAANRLQILTLSGGEYVSQKPKELGEIRNIAVVSRNAGGVAEELVIEGEKATYKVITELNIRYVLCDGMTKVLRQDGSSVEMKSLLPSGFFVISTVQEQGNVVGYKLSGGGFGHGAGMSQNGAKNMAQAGYTAQQILEFFYAGCRVY